MAQTTVYRRVFTSFVIAISTGSIIAWWIATTLLLDTLEARVEDQTEEALSVIANGRFPLTQELLDELSILQSAHFALIDHEGAIVMRTAGLGNQAWLDAIVETRRAGLTGVHTAPDFTLHLHDLADLGGRGRYAAVAGITSTSDLHEAVNRAALLLGAVAALTIGAFALWGHRISLSLTRPLEELVGTAQQIAAGARSAPRHDTAIREIAVLDEAINDMAKQLQAFETDMEQKSRLQGLGELAARVAHEVRNPLTAMKLQAQLLSENSAGSEVGELGKRLLAEIERLQLVVDSALAMGRPLEISLTRGDLNRTVSEVMELLEAQLAHRRIDVQLQLGRLPPLNLDANRMKQVIFNVVINAANALPDGGEVSLGTEHVGESVYLTVEDSGPGFAPAQAKRTAAQAPAGLGLGLEISTEIVNRHGGTVELSSSARLGGAALIIKLPTLSHAQQNEALHVG